MCGIAGIIGLDKGSSEPLIRSMTDGLRHRGPDAGAVFVDQGVALGHRRLSIIDLSAVANQPLFDIDKRYVIVFNGEIYNYADLRKQIEYSWQTTSDTEVILAAYIKWGKDCLQHLNGMFAFAIWDQAAKELFAARDRLGVKPFYYYHLGDLFIFASEVRSILATGLVEKKLDQEVLVDYLSGGSVKTPHTIIQNIRQLNPGEYALFRKGKLSRSSYWRIYKTPGHNGNFSLTYGETVDQTRRLFLESVKSRMVADVPVGAFLSGGIDSSAIVAAMTKFTDRPVETFSIAFKNEKFDESKYARIIAEKYRTNHTELFLEPDEIVRNLPEYLSKMDSPTIDGINTYIVSKMVSQTGIKVALSGIGGDELFAGYPGFVRWKRISQNQAILNNGLVRGAMKALGPFFNSRSMRKIAGFYEQDNMGLCRSYRSLRSVFLDWEIKDLTGFNNRVAGHQWVDLDDDSISEYPCYSQYSIAELTHYTLDMLLKDTDQMSMAWGLEVREPFFDYRLVEFILSVPDKFKCTKSTPKSLFVDAMGDLLPAEIVNRPKMGFSFPWDQWLRNELKEFCEVSLENLSNREFFKNLALRQIFDDFLSNKRAVKWMHVWSLVVLEHWLTENGIKI